MERSSLGKKPANSNLRYGKLGDASNDSWWFAGMRNFGLLAALVVFLIFSLIATSSAVQAQTNPNEFRARALYEQAVRDMTAGDHATALERVNKVEELLGESNARLTALRVELLFELKRYEDAQSEYNRFFEYPSSPELSQRVAELSIQIDDRRRADEERARSLADFLDNGLPDENLDNKALRHACRDGDVSKCAELGASFFNTDTNPSEAYLLFRHSCEAGNMRGCNGQGQFYINGNGVDQDVPLGLSLVRQACDEDEFRACLVLGLAYSNGDIIERNDEQAMKLFARSCNGGGSWACARVGYAYEMGIGGLTKNPSEAARLYLNSCEGNPPIPVACTNLGLAYKAGRGVKRSKKRARQFFKLACELGHQRGCDLL